ncbi:MAG TPA: cation diffusion facilitator family transporter [Anaerolineaceae bacterium]|nr:cation diffusion facilitator family transporter [Anaerolineaceae bacterium]HPN50917.1 cation diffusion facilitator family transporter [Anaerolineaceae bacterium]
MRYVRLYSPNPEQAKLFRKALVITFTGNLILAASKMAVALTAQSAAIMSDGLMSSSDLFYSAMMVLGFWLSMQPPDISHPQGHSRYEPLIGMMIMIAMAFAAYQAVVQSFERFLNPQVIDPISSLVLAFGAVTKLGMYFLIKRIADRTRNPTLRTTAIDNLSDVFTTSGAFIGALGSNFIHPLTDPIAGTLVGLVIARNAFNAGRENLNFIVGAGADQETTEKMVAMVREVPDVLDIHLFCTEYSGTKLVVDMHINCDPNLPLSRVHDVESEIIHKLKLLDEVDRVYVHVEPIGLDND